MHTNLDQRMIYGQHGQAARLNEARRCVAPTANCHVRESTRTGLRWYDRVARSRGRNSLPTAHCVSRQATRAPLPSMHVRIGVVRKAWLFRICDFLGKHFPSPCGSVAATVRTLEVLQEIA